MQASQVLPHQTGSSMSLWTLLCALVRSHVGTGRGHPQTVSTKLGVGLHDSGKNVYHDFFFHKMFIPLMNFNKTTL